MRLRIHYDNDGQKSIGGPFDISYPDYQQLRSEYETWRATRSNPNSGEYHVRHEDGTGADIRVAYFLITRIEELPPEQPEETRIGFRD